MIVMPLITELAEAITFIVLGCAGLASLFDTVKIVLHERGFALFSRNSIVNPEEKERKLENVKDIIDLIDKLLSDNEKMKTETLKLRMHVEQIQHINSTQAEKSLG